MSLIKIENKILSGRRLTPEDAVALFDSDDIFTMGRLAGYVARQKNGNNAYFIHNHHINPTNLCVNRCKFCAFSRSNGDKGAYELTIKQITKKLTSTPVFSEVHIVGGLHPEWRFDYYLEMLSAIKHALPGIHIKAFTAVEIDYFAKISNLSLKDTLISLKHAGLDSIPGGGAEIFNGQIRKKICPEKISGKRWLRVMETVHNAGMKSNATMLYGHLESHKHRVEHLLMLRDLQDKTKGFQAFIPLAFHPMHTRIDKAHYTSGIDDIKTIAISRLFLDNFEHIKAYWIMLGEKLAQLALIFGADDLDGTIIEEKITHSAGALSAHAMTRWELINLIECAGKTPVERDSYYRPVKRGM
jgi:aminodeoxyfutalosine synthase